MIPFVAIAGLKPAPIVARSAACAATTMMTMIITPHQGTGRTRAT